MTDSGHHGHRRLRATPCWQPPLDDPLFDAHLGSMEDFERNLRGWGEACGADPDMVDALVATLRRAGQ